MCGCRGTAYRWRGLQGVPSSACPPSGSRPRAGDSPWVAGRAGCRAGRGAAPRAAVTAWFSLAAAPSGGRGQSVPVLLGRLADSHLSRPVGIHRRTTSFQRCLDATPRGGAEVALFRPSAIPSASLHGPDIPSPSCRGTPEARPAIVHSPGRTRGALPLPYPRGWSWFDQGRCQAARRLSAIAPRSRETPGRDRPARRRSCPPPPRRRRGRRRSSAAPSRDRARGRSRSRGSARRRPR